MRFGWFWTFWHWSRDSFREGAVLRGPLHGIGSHWDEWFRHEAVETDLKAIARVGESECSQQEFIGWITDVWSKEIEQTNPSVARFVLSQLADLPPFVRWKSMSNYRSGYGTHGISAIILADGSAGEAADVRSIDAILLPPEVDESSPKIVTEGFRADVSDVEEPRRAALDVLGGWGLAAVLGLWAAVGRRPYPIWLRLGLTIGWATAAALILRLLFGTEPGDALVSLSAVLVALVIVLGLVEFCSIGWHSLTAWRHGRQLFQRLHNGHLRLRMAGGFKIEGGSAGLPFCLNALLAASRAGPDESRGSWIWTSFFRRIDVGEAPWCATGVVTAHGRVNRVILAPKMRACLLHGGARHVLTPLQRGDERIFLQNEGPETRLPQREGALVHDEAAEGDSQLAFAAAPAPLHVRRCFHVAQAVLAIGQLGSRWQAAVSILAVSVLATVGVGFSDLRAIIDPPLAPLVVRPGSPSPYYLWVSIDSGNARHFRAIFESAFWSNRRADFFAYSGANGSVRAEIPLRRATRQAYGSEDEGIVWIERRRRFLGREYLPGDRVGRYSFSYVSRLKYE
jgi:hypothetical protein